MPGLRSLRNRLAVIFALIVLGAIATIYLSVTPRLEQSLIRQKIAQLAVLTRRVATGAEPTANGRQAIAARPIVLHKRVAYVLVFADSLSDVQANVALIRRQVLISGALALVIAVLAGYLVARALAARVKRLQRAPRKVAAGDFSQPIRAASEDELG